MSDVGRRPRTTLVATALAALALAAGPGASSVSASPPPLCDLSGLGLVAAAVTSTDGVQYTKWSGHIASWDGLPIDVDVSRPASGGCSRPLLVFAHGFTDSKTRWEAASIDGQPTDPNAWRWNNVAFVARGYTVLNYTARGWHGSCGPDSSTDPASSPLGLPSECTGGDPAAPTRQYWIHLDDLRYEVRDAQWLTGRLADAGVADPDHVGVTGGSYGGGLTWLMAVANDRVMCGGVGWDAGNGVDPCAGATDGQLVAWRSPGGLPMHVAAAVPEYTWASLVQVLLPNGRASDQAPGAPVNGDMRIPVGVPLESYTDALFAAGYAPPATKNGFFQPPSSTDQTANIPLWVSVLKTGIDTVSVQAPGEAAIADDALTQLQDFKSPVSARLPFDARVPIFQLQGLTDPLFPALHAQLMWNRARAYAADYPIGVFFGDYGHPYASNLGNVPHAFNPLAAAFLDHHLLGVGPGTTLQATAALVNCASGGADDPLTMYQAPSLAALADGALQFASNSAGQTSNLTSGTEGPQTDPVSNGVIGPGLFGTRCPHVPRTDDPGQGSWTFSIDAASTVIGSPIVRLQVRSTGVDAELGTRLWDLAPDGTQTLMSRGTYRFAQAPSSADTSVAYELSPTAWQLPAGHLVKLEVSGADWPYFQLDRIPAVTTVDAVSLRLPTTSAAPLGLPHPAAGAAPPSPSALPLTASMPGGAPAIPVVAVAIALLATWRFARRGSR
ncbi:MAG: type transport system ATP-binding protein [Chloroflexota bacterium]|jgi:hypothetical protein|nr:type transport system ATP-binding protein [Chloroflexota bacterium]